MPRPRSAPPAGFPEKDDYHDDNHGKIMMTMTMMIITELIGRGDKIEPVIDQLERDPNVLTKPANRHHHHLCFQGHQYI